MIAPVYYACKLFGILPVSYASCGKIPYKNTVHFIGRRDENGETIIILWYYKNETDRRSVLIKLIFLDNRTDNSYFLLLRWLL